MLTTRTPLGTDEDYVARDAGVPELLKKGKYSVLEAVFEYNGQIVY